MGRATRWFKGIFGVNVNNERDIKEYSGNSKDKSWWCSGYWVRDDGVLCQNPTRIPPNITPAEAAWLRSFYSEPDDEQKQHARAVAAATAAAADAAVAAARAAAVVVRLTSRGRMAAVLGGSREKRAAVKIQSAFRRYLARKALRALKGLVKLQAMVRGYLVRKEAAATLRSMQVLVRAQANVRARRLLISTDESCPQFQAPKSLDKFEEDTTSLDSRRLSASFEAFQSPFEESPKIVEVDMTCCMPKSKSRMSVTGEDSLKEPMTINTPFTRKTRSRSSSRNLSPDQECFFPSAQSTPRFTGSCNCSAATAKNFRSYIEHDRNKYMANTQSFEAKMRSQSVPKLRPERSGIKSYTFQDRYHGEAW